MAGREGDPPYERVRNPNLQWGYWFLAVGRSAGWPPLQDEHGRQWSSLRQALWVGRLGMPDIGARDIDEALEFLLSVLVTLDRRIIGSEERAHDIFEGDWQRSRFYACWLHSHRLVQAPQVNGIGLDGPLSPEGRAILRMLASTRPPGEVPLAIGLEWIRGRRGRDHGRERGAMTEMIEKQERFADELDYRFVRGQVQNKPIISLIGLGLGPNIPLRRTVWSMTFPDEYARDRMYLWLHERLDRWSAWGDVAYRRGAKALGEHLLMLSFCDQTAAPV